MTQVGELGADSAWFQNVKNDGVLVVFFLFFYIYSINTSLLFLLRIKYDN